MKKTGFTLPELLITLGVIGVASALILPAISNIMPDKNKIMVLNAYSYLGKVADAISDASDKAKDGKSMATLLTEHLSAEKGATWTITETTNGGAVAILDVNGDKGKNCIYGETCKKPDEFKFVIDEDGDTHPADALTMAYLENPLNTGDKKKDLKRAESITVEDWESKQSTSSEKKTRYDLSNVKVPGEYKDPNASDEQSDQSSDQSSDSSSGG